MQKENRKLSFSSPQRGSFLSTLHRLTSHGLRNRLFSSPQRGSFLSTMNSELIKSSIATVFVPSTGFFSIYKLDTMYETGKLKVFVPSTGFFSIYDINLTYSNKVNEVFVPSTGFFSIYGYLQCMCDMGMMFSSPQRGSFLSTKNEKNNNTWKRIVFVPSTGFFSIYNVKRNLQFWNSSFRPLNGVLFYLLSTYHVVRCNPG